MGSRDRPGCESTRKPVKAAGCGAGKEPSKLPLSIVMDNIPGTSLFSSSYFSTRSQAELGAAGQGGESELPAGCCSFWLWFVKA